MPYTPDLTVYSPDGDVRLLVEVKTRGAQEDDWARQYRRNILAHFPDGGTAYFLLVLPENVYLWQPDSDPDAEADFVASTRESLGRHYEEVGMEDLGSRALEFLVKSWLSDLIAFERDPDVPPPEPQWLSASGLYETIRGGSVKREVPV